MTLTFDSIFLDKLFCLLWSIRNWANALNQNNHELPANSLTLLRHENWYILIHWYNFYISFYNLTFRFSNRFIYCKRFHHELVCPLVQKSDSQHELSNFLNIIKHTFKQNIRSKWLAEVASSATYYTERSASNGTAFFTVLKMNGTHSLNVHMYDRIESIGWL